MHTQIISLTVQTSNVGCRDLERQHVQDKDAWKKNTAQQLKDTRDRMQKLSENQLETLTKRTILENEAMAAELKYQSRQVSLLTITTCQLVNLVDEATVAEPKNQSWRSSRTPCQAAVRWLQLP